MEIVQSPATDRPARSLSELRGKKIIALFIGFYPFIIIVGLFGLLLLLMLLLLLS